MNQGHPPETARVPEAHPPGVVESPHHVHVLRVGDPIRVDQGHLPRHAQLDHDEPIVPAIVAENKRELLTQSLEPDDPRPNPQRTLFDPPPAGVGVIPAPIADHITTTHIARDDRVIEDGLESSSNGFDLGEFGHDGSPVGFALGAESTEEDAELLGALIAEHTWMYLGSMV